jgi:hypothetical protein
MIAQDMLNAFTSGRQFRNDQQDRQRMLQQEQAAQGMANTQGKIENAFMQGNPQQAGALAQSSGDAGLMQGVQQRQQGMQQATRDQDGQRNDRLGQFATGLAATPVAQRGQAFDAIVPELFSYGLTPDQAVDIRSRLVDPNQSDAVIAAYMSRSVSPDTMFEATAPQMQGENQVLNRFQGGELTQGPVNPNAPINQAVDQQNANTAQQRANTPRGPLVNVQTGEQGPRVGTIPPGFQLVQGADGGYSMSPIPGGPAAQAAAADAAAGEARQGQAEQFGSIAVDEIDRALGILENNPGAGGRNAVVAGFDPESQSSSLQRLYTTIGAYTSFDRLQRMREASPTGGALGAVSERELAMLQNAYGALDPTAPVDEQVYNLTRLSNMIRDVVDGPGNGPRAPLVRPQGQTRGQVRRYDPATDQLVEQ